MAQSIRVLVVDDSPLMRRVISDAIGAVTDITVVGTANDGDEALARFRELKPDVVTLDMQMPGKNGLEVLAEILEIAPTPVIMVSSLTQRAADVTLTALDNGAVDYLGKPENPQQLETVLHDELIKKIRANAWTDVRRVIQIRRNRKMRAATAAPVALASRPQKLDDKLRDACVAIGISTGGPPALTYLFESLAPPLPPIVVVQHMPQQVTGPFAERLDRISQLSVKEAATGDVLEPNHVLVAPGGKHLYLRERSGKAQVEIADGEPVCCHKPSVDVMMNCAAQIFGPRCLGVIMTGMGRDGADGCRAVRAAGGYVLGQDQASSDVYGMNKVAFTGGSVHEQFSLEDAPAAIVAALANLQPRAAIVGAR
jgi:two-component system, chemotaxis family, protein-glutamate methylesterase/glutaminase